MEYSQAITELEEEIGREKTIWFTSLVFVLTSVDEDIWQAIKNRIEEDRTALQPQKHNI